MERLAHPAVGRMEKQSVRKAADPQRGDVNASQRLTCLFAVVRAVWQDEVEAQRFMDTPHPELGGRTPLESATTESGAREVEEVIQRGLGGLPA